MVRGSSVGLATRYGLEGPGIRSLWNWDLPSPIQTGPVFHRASYTKGIASIRGVKRPERDVDPPSSAEVEERKHLYLYSPSGSLWSVLGWTLFSFFYYETLPRNIPQSFSPESYRSYRETDRIQNVSDIQQTKTVIRYANERHENSTRLWMKASDFLAQHSSREHRPIYNKQVNYWQLNRKRWCLTKWFKLWNMTNNVLWTSIFYEGWNFNSGNYLFTTDTK